MKSKLALALGAVAALAVLAPVQAAAQNFQFQCPGCTTVGGGPRYYSESLYQFQVDEAGSYGLLTVGTATGVFQVTIYNNAGAEGTPGTAIFSCTFTDPSDNSIGNCGAAGAMLAANTTYYLGAQSTTPCTTGQGCNLVVMLDRGADGVPDSTVPEPATMLLLGTGLVGLVGARRRRKTEV